MRRREFLALLAGAMAAGAAQAQDRARLRSVAVLMPTTENDPEVQGLSAAFRKAMQDFGWTAGRNIRIAYRWGAGDAQRIRALADALVAAAPDVILAGGAPAVAALKRTASTIPVVFMSVSDPVRQGFVQSLAHPGGSVTGITNFDETMGGSWLGLMKEAAPGVRRIAILYNPTTAPYTELFLRAAAEAAPPLGLATEAAPVRDETEIQRAVAALGRAPGGGLMVPSDAFTYTHYRAVVAAAADARVPAIYAYRIFPANGGLISYGVDLAQELRQAAAYIDRILFGNSPGDLPVLAPTRFRLVVNAKTAKALGLALPKALVARADEVIG
jgi:ABC-type uncharacterized transport system substrate-binding protein